MPAPLARERHGLKERIRIIASGKLVTPDKVAWALCMGADFVSSARGFMFSLGCIQAMKCGSGNPHPASAINAAAATNQGATVLRSQR